MGGSLLERRRIEAELVRALMPALEAALGTERAREVLAEGIAREAERQGRELRAVLPAGIEGIVALWERLRAGGALEVEVIESTPRRFRLRVTRCRYAETYREMGIGDLGAVLSCSRDAPLVRGFDERVTLRRSRTLLEGSEACELDYELDEREAK
jgi:hypothetical protein